MLTHTKTLTQSMGKLPVDNYVSISADGGSEVCVEGHIEGIVDKGLQES